MVLSPDIERKLEKAASPTPLKDDKKLERRQSLLRAKTQSVWQRRLRNLARAPFATLTRRIIILNMGALLALLVAIMYMNSFRAGLIDARVQSLLTQGEIIAAAIAASATVETDTLTVSPERLLQLQAGETFDPFREQSLDFTINPQRIAPVLARLITPTRTRARIYDPEGILILDSRNVFTRGQFFRSELPEDTALPVSWFESQWQMLRVWLRQDDFPQYQELGPADGLQYPELARAMAEGRAASVVRVDSTGAIIVSVAVPIQRFRAGLGGLLLSTQSGDIDAIVTAERMAILRIFLVAALVSLGLSLLLASTIAGPMRKLAAAAERVRRGVKTRERIPDFTNRMDEIGHLSGALRDMTQALYTRIEAIETFAADVAHELKNPLTSLRSAVETLPLVNNDKDRDRLLAIVQHDVRRLDRLISDISDASRLDAELAREGVEPVEMIELLQTVIGISNDTRQEGDPLIVLKLMTEEEEVHVPGHDSRIGQVIANLLANARSFAPMGSEIEVIFEEGEEDVRVVVADRGAGIAEANLERIFERFYTDRPDGEAFGENSGLGLAISRQIVEAHGGRIWAENGGEPSEDEIAKGYGRGARFNLVLPRR